MDRDLVGHPGTSDAGTTSSRARSSGMRHEVLGQQLVSLRRGERLAVSDGGSRGEVVGRHDRVVLLAERERGRLRAVDEPPVARVWRSMRWPPRSS